MLENGYHDVPPGKLATVVTYLEMRRKVATRPVSLPEGVAFRAVDTTVDWYRDIFSRVGSEDWLWYGRLKLTDAALSAILDDPKVLIFTLRVAEQDEALLELDFRQAEACELAYFGLTSALIGTGAGRFLMNEAITRAWAHPIDRFHVHTCTFDSPQALAFYRRSGFEPVQQKVFVDDDPRLSGVLPETSSGNVPIFTPEL